MNAHPMLRTFRRAQGVYVFPSAQAMIDAMRGPQQHAQHVEAYRNHLWITERQAANRRADAAVRAYLAEQGVKL